MLKTKVKAYTGFSLTELC